jgi:hypothetical protein
MLSAKRAAFTIGMGQRPREDRSSKKNASAEGAIHFWRHFVSITSTALISANDLFGIVRTAAELSRAFSACLPGESIRWGDAPG